MATRKDPKIVLYEDGASGEEIASQVKGGKPIPDALSILQTDEILDEAAIPITEEGRYFCANLSNAEAKRIEERPDVVAVVDDIEVFALDHDKEEFGDLEVDAEEIEAIEDDPNMQYEEEGEFSSPQDFQSYCEIEPDSASDEMELSLMDDLEPPTAPDGSALDLPKIPTGNLLRIVRCLVKCLGTGSEASQETIRAALLQEEIEPSTEAVTLARDIILPNLWQIWAPWAWRYSTGRRARVAVIDTGISSRHPDLRVNGGVSFVPGRASWNDDNGHGTHVAGTIAARWNRRGIVGVAPRASLYAVKVLDRQGRGRLSWILNGLAWCGRRRMHIANLSLGSPERTHNPRVFNRAYEHVGRRLRRRNGILLVAAAGNSRRRPVGNPARCPSFLAVSAIDSRRRLAGFSNVGPQVELAAPGVRILSTIPGGYGRKSGTSMASPHVAAVAALVKSRRPSWHGDRIRVHLWRTALDLGTPGRDWAFGYGQVNALRAVR